MRDDQHNMKDFKSTEAITISRSGSFDLQMTPDEAMPRFTAVGEKLWISDWNLVFFERRWI